VTIVRLTVRATVSEYPRTPRGVIKTSLTRTSNVKDDAAFRPYMPMRHPLDPTSVANGGVGGTISDTV